MLSTWLLPELWRDLVQDPGREGVFLVLASFLVAFVLIRTSARMSRSDRFAWWPGSVVTDSGVHLHHLVWGIVLMVFGGTLGFALGPDTGWFRLSAVAFGVGVGLTFDEFALWVHLRDVYWAREGRTSIDAVAVTAAFMGLVVLGINPLRFTGDDVLDTLVSVAYSLTVLVVSGVCFTKSRFVHGFATFVLPPVGMWAALRLAKPGSPWARLRYGDRDPERHQTAVRRFRPERRASRISAWVRHHVGGFADEREAQASLAAAAELHRQALGPPSERAAPGNDEGPASAGPSG